MDLSFLNLPFSAEIKFNLSDQFLTGLINSKKPAMIDQMAITCKNSYLTLTITARLGFIKKNQGIDLIIHDVTISKNTLKVTLHYKSILVMGLNVLLNILGVNKFGHITIQNHEILADFSEEWQEIISKNPDIPFDTILPNITFENQIYDGELEIKVLKER